MSHGPTSFSSSQMISATIRHDTLGCAGHKVVQTPTIDRLANSGVRFENMFVTRSTCHASRTTILTGLFSRSSVEPDRSDRVKPEALAEMFPDLLRGAGYRTGFFGKWHAKMPKGFRPEDHFEEYEKIFRNPYFKTMVDGTRRHTTELIGDRGIQFLKTQRDEKRPFCLNLWFNAGHAEDRDRVPGIGHYPWPRAMDGKYEDVTIPAPRLSAPAIYEAHPEFFKKSNHRERFHWRWDTPEKYQTNMRAYFRMLTGIDHVMNRVLQTLKEEGLADNTIVVYAADNGYYMGDRGFAGKWSHHEQSLRVPLVIYDPRLPEELRGRAVDTTALNLDLPPTFLDWAGVPAPASYQGASLKPVIEGDLKPEGWREEFFCEHFNPRYSMSWEGVRGQRFKYARYVDQKLAFEYLHDLQNAPDELINLAGNAENRALLKRMRQRTDALADDYAKALTANVHSSSPSAKPDATADQPRIELNTDDYQSSCGIEVTQDASLIQVTWPLDAGRRGRLTFDLTRNRPLIHTAAASPKGSASFRAIAKGLDPIVQIRIGNRDLEKRGSWTVFFDRMQRKPSEVFRARVEQKRAIVTSNVRRATLTIGDVSAGPFQGQLRWTFYAGSSFVLQEAVLKTERDGTAYLYDTGLVCRETEPTEMSWRDSFGPLQTEVVDAIKKPRHVAVRGRAIAARFSGGSIGLFPPPHRYFYPLDYSTNLKNIWMGPNYANQ